MSSKANDQKTEDTYEKETRDSSSILWLFLWLATLYHAGVTAWALLSTAQLPPGYQVPPMWVENFRQGPTSDSFWIYIIVLGVNILRESWFKSQKTYVPSLLYPEFKYGNVAVVLWAGLWVFSQYGHDQGWFPVPDQVNKTFGSCLILWIAQHLMIRLFKSTTFMEAFKDVPKQTKAVVPKPHTPPPSPQASLAVSGPAPKKVVSNNSDLAGKLLDYIRQNGQAKTSGMMSVLGSPRRTVIRNLNKLLKDGRLIREGSGAGAVYRLNENPKGGK